MSKKMESKNNIVENDLDLNKEVKVILRFTRVDQIQLLNQLKKYCQNNSIKLNSYLTNVIMDHIEDAIKKQLIPDLTTTMYGVVRKAIYAGTIGQNAFVAQTVKPSIIESVLNSQKLNLILNILLEKVDIDEIKESSLLPRRFLKEINVFDNLREEIDKNLSIQINKLKNKNKNVEANNRSFAESVSFSEFVNTNMDIKNEKKI